MERNERMDDGCEERKKDRKGEGNKESVTNLLDHSVKGN